MLSVVVFGFLCVYVCVMSAFFLLPLCSHMCTDVLYLMTYCVRLCSCVCIVWVCESMCVRAYKNRNIKKFAPNPEMLQV